MDSKPIGALSIVSIIPSPAHTTHESRERIDLRISNLATTLSLRRRVGLGSSNRRSR